MLTAIPVRWLEDNRGWRVRTNLGASGKVLPASCRQIVLSRIAPLQKSPQDRRQAGPLECAGKAQRRRRFDCAGTPGRASQSGVALRLPPHSKIAGATTECSPSHGLRHSAARPSRNQNGARLWSKTQPQSVALGMTGVLRLVLRTQPRSGKFARPATIRTDTDRLQVCATGAASTLNTYAAGSTLNSYGTVFTPMLCNIILRLCDGKLNPMPPSNVQTCSGNTKC